MTSEEIKRLIQNGEKIDVEFKEAKNALSKDVYDSVCSFNNRNGGHIVLGVNDKREIAGVNPDKVDKIIKEFTTAINNSQKIYPPLYLTPVSIDIEEKKLIYIRVPKGCQVCRHNGRIWDRSYEGDINITDNAELVYKLYARKQSSYFVNKVYPNYSSGFPAKMIIDDEKITIENSNVAHGIGALDLQKFEPFPKNPSISKVFREIGIADELGSGMRNTYKYTQLYSGKNPIFEEGDIFRTIIPLKKIATEKVGEKNVPHNVPHNVPQDKKELIEFIKAKVRSNNKITRQAIADSAGVSVKTIQRTIKEIENLRYIGTGNNGHWELN